MGITIKENGKIEPKDAPIRRDGTIYFLTDDIEITSGDGIRVEKDNIIIDGKSHLIISTSASGIDASFREGVEISDIRIQGFNSGISISESSGIVVNRNEVVDCWECGIFLGGSNIEITENKFIGCGLYVYGSCDNVAIKGNTVNGKPLFFLKKKSNKKIRNVDIGQLILVNCKNIVVEDLKIVNTSIGVQLAETKNSVVRNNELMDNYYGIILQRSFENTIEQNILENNDFAICFQSSQKNIINDNRIRHNGRGISIRRDISIISVGELSRDNNIISSNTIEHNELGLEVFSSSGNRVYHNNFISNRNQVSVEDSANVWDDGFKGNYWSDYLGSDSDGNGVGDSPYFIDENNIDNYPLMPPFLFHKVELVEPANNATLVPPVRLLVKVLSNGEPVRLIPLILHIGSESVNLLTDSKGYAELKDWIPRVDDVVTVEWWAEAIKNGHIAKSEKRRLTCLPLPPPPEEEEMVREIEEKKEKVRGFLRKLESEE